MNVPTTPSVSKFPFYMKPKLDRDYHFHSIMCLSKWKKLEDAQKLELDKGKSL